MFESKNKLNINIMEKICQSNIKTTNSFLWLLTSVDSDTNHSNCTIPPQVISLTYLENQEDN